MVQETERHLTENIDTRNPPLDDRIHQNSSIGIPENSIYNPNPNQERSMAYESELGEEIEEIKVNEYHGDDNVNTRHFRN